MSQPRGRDAAAKKNWQDRRRRRSINWLQAPISLEGLLLTERNCSALQGQSIPAEQMAFLGLKTSTDRGNNAVEISELDFKGHLRMQRNCSFIKKRGPESLPVHIEYRSFHKDPFAGAGRRRQGGNLTLKDLPVEALLYGEVTAGGISLSLSGSFSGSVG